MCRRVCVALYRVALAAHDKAHENTPTDCQVHPPREVTYSISLQMYCDTTRAGMTLTFAARVGSAGRFAPYFCCT